MRRRERARKLKFNTQYKPSEWSYCNLCDTRHGDHGRMVLVQLGPYTICIGCYEQITAIKLLP